MRTVLLARVAALPLLLVVGCRSDRGRRTAESGEAARSAASQATVAAPAPSVGSAAPSSAARAVATSSAAPSALAAPPAPEEGRFVDALDVSRFLKGNLHTHSSNSDGRSPPRDVYRWYRDHGYAFLAMTDHNQRSSPKRYHDLERKGFVIIPGEEITMGSRSVPVHVNALCTTRPIGNVARNKLDAFATVGDALRWAIAEVRAQDGVALVNHPNFQWAFTAKDLGAAAGAQLLEIWSGHPFVHSEGDAKRPSEEAIWDAVSTRGESFAGVAVDDTHALSAYVPAMWRARPGRGWVQVFADEPTAPAICDALRRGRLYASSGAELRRLVVAGDSLSVWPAEAGARVDFIGAGGAVLDTQHPAPGAAATYRLHGGETYVRARVVDPSGRHAWTQAYRVTSKPPEQGSHE